MPTLVNGFGTLYVGKRKVQKRKGACQRCGRTSELSSYDTRLWFAVFFVPVVPLGRKHIRDRCPTCTYHFVLQQDRWDAAKQLDVSGAREKFRADPTPETAVDLHRHLITYEQMEAAAELRRSMAEQFPDHAGVQLHIAAALEHLGKLDDAAPFFARALELRPDMLEARVGVAGSMIRAGRLDEARGLLDFMKDPGAAQLCSLEPLEHLARAYQTAGRHEEALQALATLLSALPGLGRQKGFRKLVARSEKELGKRESILPRIELHKRPLVRIAAVLVLALAAAAAHNEYIRRHRTLHIVNGSGQPATIEVEGLKPVQARPGVTNISISEGRYRASIGGPAKEVVDLVIEAAYLSRWFEDPAWVLNVGGAALLLETTAEYSAHPYPATTTLHFGKPFERFARVTHPFTALPARVALGRSRQAYRTSIELFHGDMAAAFAFQLARPPTARALDLAEWWLKLHPGDDELLHRYAGGAENLGESDRVSAFLETGLESLPLRMEWHRVYQWFRGDRASYRRLAARYDEMLRGAPEDSALLYLRARVEADHAVARELLERARRADPSSHYPLQALGYVAAARGDWSGAKELFQQAIKIRPADTGLIAWSARCRLALGETDALELELRERVKKEPFVFDWNALLCQVLAAGGKKAEARLAADAFARFAAADHSETATQAVLTLRREVLRAVGDWPALEELAARSASPAASEALFRALLEQGRLKDAEKVRPPPEKRKAFDLLAEAVALREGGESGEADRRLQLALLKLEEGDWDEARAAALLRSAESPSTAALDAIILEPNDKMVLLTALAQVHEGSAADLMAQARRLNVGFSFPHYLIERVAARLRS